MALKSSLWTQEVEQLTLRERKRERLDLSQYAMTDHPFLILAQIIRDTKHMSVCVGAGDICASLSSGWCN
jgi:hypothetical protein